MSLRRNIELLHNSSERMIEVNETMFRCPNCLLPLNEDSVRERVCGSCGYKLASSSPWWTFLRREINLHLRRTLELIWMIYRKKR